MRPVKTFCEEGIFLITESAVERVFSASKGTVCFLFRRGREILETETDFDLFILKFVLVSTDEDFNEERDEIFDKTGENGCSDSVCCFLVDLEIGTGLFEVEMSVSGTSSTDSVCLLSSNALISEIEESFEQSVALLTGLAEQLNFECLVC